VERNGTSRGNARGFYCESEEVSETHLGWSQRLTRPVASFECGLVRRTPCMAPDAFLPGAAVEFDFGAMRSYRWPVYAKWPRADNCRLGSKMTEPLPGSWGAPRCDCASPWSRTSDFAAAH